MKRINQFGREYTITREPLKDTTVYLRNIRTLFNSAATGIYVRSQRAGERVMESISNFIEGKLKLIVNREKSQVCQVNQTKFLGYTIQKDGFLSIANKSVERLKEKVRTITKRNRGVKFEQVIAKLEPVMRGWLNYFHSARCRSLLKELDSWIRRKLRCYRLKQCKRVITLQLFLESRGVSSWQSWILALSGKGHWRKSGCPQAHQALSNKWFDEVGLYNLTLRLRQAAQLKETAVYESMHGGVIGRGSNPLTYSI